MVSCESLAVPAYHPATERLPLMSDITLIVNGSAGAAGTK
jgi:hypothetical protein